MKHNYFYFLGSLFTAISAFAQPTLDFTNNAPKAGDSFLIHAAPYKRVDPALTGANYVWDYSWLTSSGTQSSAVGNASASPMVSNFPGATITAQAGNTTAFFSTSSSSYEMKGSASVQSGVSSIIPYSDPEKLMAYPFTYNNSYTDNLYASYSSNGMALTRSGTVKVKADGYGTIKLPYGTINNVLRVQIVENYSDNMGSTPFFTYVDTVYAWYLPGVHGAVFSVTNFITNGSLQANFSNFLDQSNINVNEIVNPVSNLSVFPNPASNKAFVQYALNENSPLKITVLNLLGEEVKTIVNIEKQSIGNYRQEIDLAALPQGVYFIQLNTESNAVTKKIIVE